MMAHADYFVGSFTSGISHIIQTLRMTVYLKSQVSPISPAANVILTT